MLFFQGDNQVKGDCSNIIAQNNFDSSSKNCFYPINIIQIIKLQEIICVLANDQIQQISQINPNLIFPSINCQNIRTLYPGASYYGKGGDNCDYTQPIVFNFNSSPYYAQRVFLFPIQWVFSLCDNCPTITSSLSVNDLVPISLHSPKSLFLSVEKLCDYYDAHFVFDNLNQIVTKISFTPGFYTKYIEQLYILIFKCPLGCSSCDNSLLNCQSCAVGYYLVEILAQNVTLIAQLLVFKDVKAVLGQAKASAQIAMIHILYCSNNVFNNILPITPPQAMIICSKLTNRYDTPHKQPLIVQYLQVFYKIQYLLQALEY
ncbi:hypothetical protein ABPG72_018383 [Tetrahymena utriculariae]